MRPLYRLLHLLVVAAAPLTALADSGPGLSLPPDAVPWARFNSRIAISAIATPLRSDLSLATDVAPVRGLSLMGDYYLTHSLLGPTLGGGLRATSALLVGPRTQTLGAGSLGIAGGGRGLTIERRSPVTAGAPQDSEANTTLPYVGIGYTSLSARGGFAFSADLGVVALQPGTPVRLGRSPSNPANGDETLPRLSPMLQLGVSYSF